jgi:hypothetical protein
MRRRWNHNIHYHPVLLEAMPARRERALDVGCGEGTRDLPRELVAAVATRVHKLTKDHWESPAPTIWPPAHTYAEIGAVTERVLPAARFRRHLLWRYSVVWTKSNAG